MEILEKIKRSFGMAKRFKKEKAGAFAADNKIFVEEIAERVAKEDIEEMVEIEEVIPEGKISKEEFLISKGLHERPNSHMAITAWEEYLASCTD